eukprot:c19644_g1_i4.p1 GENE.c19644_g1_i4~~c19644_g1_i4.p1  ORF type:complete len:940 (+),score=220.55 c19644_g1_i4:239-2821(+)
MIYWENVEKRGPDGKVLPEMILVCNALLNDLKHPNEYIRGCTLRLCTKLREKELLEPLITAIKDNLTHRHSYVRRNAVLAVFAIYKHSPHLIPDATDAIHEFLQEEGDPSARRNAFLMLLQCDQTKAVAHLHKILDQIQNSSDGFQLVVLELVRTLCRTQPQHKSMYIRCVLALMETASDSVLFESANTLATISNAPTAVRATAACYTQLLRSQGDSNVKLVILDRLSDLKKSHGPILQECVMEILRALGSPNVLIQRRTLELALELVTPNTAEGVVSCLKKELARVSGLTDKTPEVCEMLVRGLHMSAVRFPSVAPLVITTVTSLLTDESSTALHAVVFAREIMTTYPELRGDVFSRLVSSLPDIKSADVFRGVLWLLGHFATSLEEVQQATDAVNELLGPLPITTNNSPEQSTQTPTQETTAGAKQSGGPVVGPDGTYQTQSAVTSTLTTTDPTPLRTLILRGEHHLAAALCACITKLTFAGNALAPSSSVRTTARGMLTVVSVFRAASSLSNPQDKIDQSSSDRMSMCVRALANPTAPVVQCFRDHCHTALLQYLSSLNPKPDTTNKIDLDAVAQPDDGIVFRQLKVNKEVMTQLDIEDQESEVHRAIGVTTSDNDFASRLKRLTQLTGLSDPLYAEAVVTVHQYDIALEILVVNKTKETMQNLQLELSTVGDLKLCERPQQHALAPGATKTIKANIKVSSTETGVIFGNIVYETSSSSNADKNCVVLSDIRIDILDYMTPASCTDETFRAMWSEHEWENRVAVTTNARDQHAFLAHIIECTNMRCLTLGPALSGECGYLTANLYSRSVFGEDALMNISLETLEDGRVGGFIRIRSKTQGIALGLGDKVTMMQKMST